MAKQKFTDQQYIELYNRGLNDTECSEILDVARNVVTVRRWKLGLMPINPKYFSNPFRSLKNLRRLSNEKHQRDRANPEYHKKELKREQAIRNKLVKQNPNHWKEEYKRKKPYFHQYNLTRRRELRKSRPPSEKDKQYRKEYWLKNKKKMSQIHKKWRLANKDKRNQYMRQWRAKQKLKKTTKI